MENLILNKGGLYLLKTIKITRTQKAPFRKSDGILYFQYHVILEDKNGQSALCEYLSPSEEQDEFYLNTSRWIECRYHSPKGTPEIYPAEEPARTQTLVSLREEVSDILAQKASGETNQDPAQPNCFSVQVQGKSIAFAMGYAKDILVAEVAISGRKVTLEDIDRMLSWADKINEGMCQRIQF